MTAAIDTRLSPKPNGDYEGVEDQIAWGRTYAEKAWPGEPVEIYADKGKSAGRDDVRRQDFERLREDVRAGRVTRLWTVEQSRLTRRVAAVVLAPVLAAALAVISGAPQVGEPAT